MRVLGLDVGTGETCAVNSDGGGKMLGSATKGSCAGIRVHGEHTAVPGRENR
jgi:hypothetical protein